MAAPPWLAEALAATHDPDFAALPDPAIATLRAALAPDQELYLLVRDRNEPAGVLIAEATGSARPRIVLLCIDRAERNLGLGAEAVDALERLLRPPALSAGIPRDNGLAIYFWLRAGFRPYYPASPDRPRDRRRFWMVRHA